MKKHFVKLAAILFVLALFAAACSLKAHSNVSAPAPTVQGSERPANAIVDANGNYQAVTHKTQPSEQSNTGKTFTDTKGFQLVTQNFSDAGQWRLLSYSDRRASTRARIFSSNIDAAGNLSVLAEGHAVIDSLVQTTSAGVSLAGQGSGAASGAGVYAQNRIQSDLEASIDGAVGSGRSKIAGNTITVSADNQATIDAVAGAASLAAAVGGLALSIPIHSSDPWRSSITS